MVQSQAKKRKGNPRPKDECDRGRCSSSENDNEKSIVGEGVPVGGREDEF